MLLIFKPALSPPPPPHILFVQDCAKHSWATYHTTQAVGVAYQNLYNNTNGLRDSFAQFWATVAANFVDSPYVIGYDIINEPWAGIVLDIYCQNLNVAALSF